MNRPRLPSRRAQRAASIIRADDTVVELDGADGLVGGESAQAGSTKTAVAAVLLVVLQPRSDGRGRDTTMRLLPRFLEV